MEAALNPLDKALALATQGDALATFEQPQEGTNQLEGALTILNEYQGGFDLTTVRIRTLLGVARR